MGAKKYFIGKPRYVGPAALACFITLSTVGCSSAGPGSGTQREDRAPALVKSEDLHLPVEDYLFSNAEQVRLDEARFKLMGKCLRRLGLNHGIESPGSPPGPRSLMERRYGITNEKDAKAVGYRLAETPRPRSLDSQTKSLTAPQKKELMKALQGEIGSEAGGGNGIRVNGLPVPEGGCAGEAAEKISGGSGRLGPGKAARSANLESWAASKADQRVARALGAWSTCMKEKGYSYPDPLIAMSDPGFQEGPPTSKERRTALADIECKRKTNLVGVWFDVESALQKDMIAREKSDFSAALKLKNSQLKRAASVLEIR
ncbi:hypothetical protein [Streptomyces enissocaesilis]|uniref:Lipoprotein n=1 Tax=Streptomyces enissocaesilis TaxID=332589 RepID=A0ABP6J9W4_9ACTN